jgi:hypothetical protein
MADENAMEARQRYNKERDERITRDMASEAEKGNPRAVESGYEKERRRLTRVRSWGKRHPHRR